MSVPPELWQAVSQLLDEALDLEASDRSQWLAQLEATRPELANHLRSLLKAHDSTVNADPLNGPPAELLIAALSNHAATHDGLIAGHMIGPYRLINSIGEGGMASVWLAEQTVNVLRRVALKIPHSMLEAPDATAARFIHERDLLAGLEHPHIARLYDANISADQQPYLAIEWIDGIPITRYADEHRLDITQRIELFQQVLQAVRFAHARLIIHRDLKASNILVTANGEVKLLDFGIAALLDDASTNSPIGSDSTKITRALTPDTASPEQLAGETLGTPTDVYSLGIVLHELLTGQRPYHLSHDNHDAKTLYEALMMTPITPLPQWHFDEMAAASRNTSIRKLRRTLAGDLEAICDKALHKRAIDRYESVEGMSADLSRWRVRLPVEARRSSVTYRIYRFISRNRIPVIAGSIAVLALCVGLSVALWQAARARQEARITQSVQSFVSSLFDANDPQQAQGHDITAKELLARGAERLNTELQDQPLVLARLQHEIGGLYIKLGDNVAARPHLERSLQLYQQLGQTGSEDAIDASFSLMEAFDEELQIDKARELATHTLALADQNFGPHNRWRLPIRTGLAWLVMDAHPQEAVDLVTQALDEALHNDPKINKEVLKARAILGNAYLQLGQFEHARDIFAQIVHDAPAVADYELTDFLVDRYNLVRTHYILKEFAQANLDLEKLVPDMDRQIGPEHDRTIKSRALWAQALAELGQFQRAVEIERQNLRYAQSRSSVDEEIVNLQKITLARLLKSSFMPTEGLPLAREGMAFFDAKYPEPFWNREIARRLLGELLLEDHQIDAAMNALETATTNASQIDGYAKNILYADILQVEAMALHVRGHNGEHNGENSGENSGEHSGDTERSVKLLSQALVIFTNTLGENNPATLRCAAHLAWLQALQEPPDTAATARFEHAAATFGATLPREHVGHAELLLMEAELLRHDGFTDKANDQQKAGMNGWRATMHNEFKPPFIMLH
jgi:serine/threonine-protein kinase